ncbi:MAG: hypothetical protein WC277_09265, partial [Bacilli bacterium]
MKKLTKINVISPIISLLILSISISFAYFNAIITGDETIITGDAGTMTIKYDGGPDIVVGDLIPSSNSFATKTFTVKGNSSVTQEMDYNISMVMSKNTFTDYGLAYKLTSTNTNNNGTIIPSTTYNMCYFKTGPTETTLGTGIFTGPTSGEKTHTYTLDLYFPEADYQSENVGKTFEFKIKIEAGTKPASICESLYSKDKILAQYGGSSSISVAPAGTFDNINGSTDNLMYKMEDDYGTSYYYRGAQAHVNNNLIFANHQWKIVRINGDGSIRIIYNGTCPSGTCTINTTGTATQMGTSAFNSSYNDNKYVGYMYGGAAGTASTSRAQATTNETSSTVKTYLDTWYSTNILNTDYEDYISDTLFCNDRQLESEVGGAATGTGFGTSETYYAAQYRLYITKTPSLKCGLKNDRFTVSDTVKGNGALTYPIGLLTPDETAIA